MSYQNQIPSINIDNDFNHHHHQISLNSNSVHSNNSLSKSPNNYNTVTISPNLTNTTITTNSTTASPVSFLSINSTSTSYNMSNSNNHSTNRPMSLDFTPLNLVPNDLQQQQQQQAIPVTQPQLGIKNRHRAGTLPSRFQSSASSSLLSNPSNPSNTLNMSPSLNLFKEDPNEPIIKNRLRSNSYQNTIWSNPTSNLADQVSPLLYPNSNPLSNSNPNLITPNFNHLNPSMLPLNDSNILPPPLQSLNTSGSNNNTPNSTTATTPQQRNAANRVRSFSTNNAIANHPDLKNYYLQQFSPNNTISEENELDHLTNQLLQIMSPQHNNTHHLTFSLDNSVSSQHHQPELNERPRAQTYTTGTNPNIPLVQLSLQQQQQQSQAPLLLDDVPQSRINFISTFQDSTLAPCDTVILVNLPNNGLVTSYNFYKILSKFGMVRAVRIISCANGDLVCLATFDSVESAVNCKLNLNNQELIPGLSCIVAFAKIIDANVENAAPSQHPHSTTPPKDDNANSPDSMFPELSLIENLDIYKQAIANFKDDLTVEEYNYLNHIIVNSTTYKAEPGFGPLPESSVIREFDSPKLREIRKDIESNKLSQLEVEQLSLAMIQEIPELASDYLGNTIVQKLFDVCSAPIRDIMLLKLSPYLSQMGIHKNGTWAAQKLMTTATTAREKNIISHSLKPYCSNLFNDQFGNYVLQCVLKFGSPWNDFITELILSNFLDISKGRFGARAIRACLESTSLTKEQTVAISGSIITNCNNLATNANGSLLVTWYLDTCQLSNRHMILLPYLIPNLLTLCTHKLGSLTVLKILNFRNDLQSRNLLLKEIFGESIFNDNVSSSNNEILPVKTTQLLHDILGDNVNGVTFIYKTLSIPLLEPALKQRIVQLIRIALIDLNVMSYQGYKRLLEEVGLKSTGANNTSNGGSSMDGKRSYGRRSIMNNGTNRNGLSGYFQPPPQQLLPQQFMSMDQFYHLQLVQQQQQQAQQHLMQPQAQQYMPEYGFNQQQQPPYMINQQQQQHMQYNPQQQQQQLMQNDVLNQLERLSLASLARGYSDSPISQQHLAYL